MSDRTVALRKAETRFAALRRLIARYGLVALALIPAAAEAQDNSAQNQAVVNPRPDINGVDVATAQYSVASPLGFNAPAAGHLQVRSVFNGRRFTTNLETYLTDDTLTDPDSGNPNSRQIRVHVEGVDRLFVCVQIGLCQQVAKVDGARLTRTADKSYSFQGREGTVVSFFPMYVQPIPVCTGGGAGCNGANYGGFAYASSIAYANGEKLTFASAPTVVGSTMVSSISSNLGYTVDAVYPCTSCSSTSSPPGSAWVLYGGLANATSYILKKNGVELDRISFSRTLTNFPGNNVGDLAAQDDWKATDKIGRTFKIKLQSKTIRTCQIFSDSWGGTNGRDKTNLNPVQVVSPNGVVTDIAYKNVTVFSAAHIVPVSSITKGGRTWLYNLVEANGGGGTLTATDPLGNSQARVAVGNPTPWVTAWGSIDAGCFVSTTGADIVQSKNEFDQQTSFAYLRQGTPSSVTFPENNANQYQYDGRGNVTRITSTPKPGSGLASIVLYQAGYDADCSVPVKCNKPNWTKDAKGGETDFEYDPVHGGEVKVTLPPDNLGVRPQKRSTYAAINSGDGTVYRLDQVSECMTLGSCAGGSDEVRRNFTYVGNTLLPATETITSGSVALTTSYTYDDAGRLATVTTPGGATTTYFYDAVGRKTATISADPDGAGPLPRVAERISYNDDDQVTKVENGSATDVTAAALAAMTVAKVADTTYNSYGEKVVDTVSSGGAVQQLVQYSYDGAARLECTAVRMNPAAFGALPATACALGAQGSEGPDRITKNVYDATGQLVQIRKALGTGLEQAYATYSFSPNGKQQYVVDANGNRAQFVYDGLDRRVQWRFPVASAVSGFNPATPATALATAGPPNAADYEQYGYDANGNRTSLRKRDGRTIAYSYDALNRVTAKDISGTCVSGYACTTPPTSAVRDVYYAYDLRGLQTTARFDNASGTDAVVNNYDGFGRMTASTVSMGGVSRTVGRIYDANGNRVRVTHPDINYFTYEYDGLNRMSAVKQNGGTQVASYDYDAKGQRWHAARGAVLTTYGYDTISRLKTLQDDLSGAAADVTSIFGYNPASQITSVDRSNIDYVYTAYTPEVKGYTVNGLNQYAAVSSASGTLSLGYDSNGNLSANGGTSFTYDVENRLVAATGTLATDMVYDPLGRLYQTSSASGIRRFLYDGDERIAEYDGAGTLLRRYVHGPAEDDPLLWYEGSGLSDRRSLQSNHQGSIVSSADPSGAVLAIKAYDEYGVPSGSDVGAFQYTGQAYLPDLGMYYYKARIYSSRLGRFLQTDPIGYADQNNLYAYVSNDPVNGRDPTGNLEVGDRFNTRDEAGRDAIKSRAGQVYTDGLEAGGRLKLDSTTKKYYATETSERASDSVTLPPVEKDDRGDWHIHSSLSTLEFDGKPLRAFTPEGAYGFDERAGGEDFSGRPGDKGADRYNITQDALIAQSKSGVSDYKGYLGTPSGKIITYDPWTGKTAPLRDPVPYGPTIPK